MRLATFILVLASAAISKAQDTNVSADTFPPVIGRYQLISAVIVISPGPPLRTEPRLFRLDTITGTVWTYNSAPMPVPAGTNTARIEIESWSQISELPNFDQWVAACSNSAKMFPAPVK